MIQFSHPWVVIKLLCYTYLIIFIVKSTERTVYWLWINWLLLLSVLVLVLLCRTIWIVFSLCNIPRVSSFILDHILGKPSCESQRSTGIRPRVRGRLFKNRAASNSKTANRQPRTAFGAASRYHGNDSWEMHWCDCKPPTLHTANRVHGKHPNWTF